MSFIGVAAGVGALGGAIKIFQGAHQNKLANKVVVPDASYETSPYAQKMYDQAQMLLNSRQPGMAAAEDNIMGSQANALGAVDRNATSGSQALAMLGGIQGNTNQAFQNLQSQEGQWKLNTLNNFNQASNAMIGEGDKVYQSDLQKRIEAINEKNALRGAGTQNIGNGINDFQNTAFLAASLKAGGNGKQQSPQLF